MAVLRGMRNYEAHYFLAGSLMRKWNLDKEGFSSSSLEIKVTLVVCVTD